MYTARPRSFGSTDSQASHTSAMSRLSCDMCGSELDSDVGSASIIICKVCKKSTSVKPPPEGTKYTRCPTCFMLITHELNSHAVLCPHCLEQVIVGPAPPGKTSGNCGNCGFLMLFSSSGSSTIICPSCGCGSILNRRRWYFWMTFVQLLALSLFFLSAFSFYQVSALWESRDIYFFCYAAVGATGALSGVVLEWWLFSALMCFRTTIKRTSPVAGAAMPYTPRP
eukprot:gnl/Spiro4/4640_TR2318_c0_g1_i2.p1 gnl/Spiro4/4640_TR2318_c0_g1~~gnl/Spiro4/4640_TR2318_c0_g1_i2.p1  ORF type:complete len:225 (-),score=25.33 gnl/Spiro4/4640_TR2318_c0_g1_i2:138-812(-)